MARILPRIKFYAPSDIAKVAPEGYRLAVLHLPFIRKFTITWWVDSRTMTTNTKGWK